MKLEPGNLKTNKAEFKTGDIVEVHRENILGNSKRFHIDCNELYDDMKPGEFILIDDVKLNLLY